MASKPDPWSFKMFHEFIHEGGHHGLCIMALWRVNVDDWKYLKLFTKRIEKESSIELGMIKEIDKKPHIYDIPVQIVHPYEARKPQLVITNERRIHSVIRAT